MLNEALVSDTALSSITLMRRRHTARGSSSNLTNTSPTPAGSLARPFLEGCGMMMAASLPYLASNSSSISFNMSSYSSSSSSSSLVTCRQFQADQTSTGFPTRPRDPETSTFSQVLFAKHHARHWQPLICRAWPENDTLTKHQETLQSQGIEQQCTLMKVR